MKMTNEGVTLWRQISETLAEEIHEGVHAPGDRLPPSSDLATRFGVNRLTVLKAINHLQGEGLMARAKFGCSHILIYPILPEFRSFWPGG